jgi:hypothetical protein
MQSIDKCLVAVLEWLSNKKGVELQVGGMTLVMLSALQTESAAMKDDRSCFISDQLL